MEIKEFEQKLQQEVDKNIEIKHDDKSPDGLSGVYYKGKFICGCPQHEIREEKNDGYGVEVHRGGENYIWIRHRTIGEVEAMVNGTVDRLKNDKDYADAFYGTGQYSDEALKSDEVKKKPQDYKLD